MLRTLAAALAAGCLAIVPACASASPPTLSIAKVAPKDGGGEPSIAGGPEGNLYVSYPSNSGMSFYRSFDSGASWEKGGIADPGSGDTAVNVDSTGAVYQANLNGDEDTLPPQAEADTFCNSIPGGVKVVQFGPHAGRIYAAWLAADPITSAATGCNETQMDTFHTVWIAWSDDGGATWTPQLVFDGGFGHDASTLFADMTLDSAGNPYIAFGDQLLDEWDMWVTASFDNGKTWNGKNDG